MPSLSETFKLFSASMDENVQRANAGYQLTGTPAPNVDPVELRVYHRLHYEKWKRETSDKTKNISLRGTTTGEAYASDTPFHQLTLISYDQLRMNVRATGLYVLLRLLEKVIAMVGAVGPVEDHVGNVSLLAACNYICPRTCPDPEQALPVGTVVILKEPFLKPGAAGGFVLRCDSPSDLLVVGRDHPLYERVQKVRWRQQVDDQRILVNFTGKTAVDWKKRGNELFKQKDYNEAREAYNVALQLITKTQRDVVDTSDMLVVLHLNLAAVYLALKYLEKTLQIKTGRRDL